MIHLTSLHNPTFSQSDDVYDAQGSCHGDHIFDPSGLGHIVCFVPETIALGPVNNLSDTNNCRLLFDASNVCVGVAGVVIIQ